jgi:hypothetical protein
MQARLPASRGLLDCPRLSHLARDFGQARLHRGRAHLGELGRSRKPLYREADLLAWA